MEVQPSVQPASMGALSSCKDVGTSPGASASDVSERAARDVAIFGGAPRELVNDLLSLLSGVVLDGADALEVSLRQLGVRPERATPTVNAVVDAFRGRFASHGACLRAYALRNVFCVPDDVTAAQVLAIAPASATAEREFRAELARLDRQIANSTQRLADAVAHRKAIDAHQRGLQRHITQLEDIAARVGAGGPDELEACVRALTASNAATSRDLAACQYSLEDCASNEAHEMGRNAVVLSTGDDVAMTPVDANVGREVTSYNAFDQEIGSKPSVLKDGTAPEQSTERGIKEVEDLATRLQRLHQ